MKPIRIQRKRVKGWKMPLNTIYVGRPTKWGNPFLIGLIACGCRSSGECDHNFARCETAKEAAESYREWITTGKKLKHHLHELKGKNLACFCPLDQPCHADILLEIANENPR